MRPPSSGTGSHPSEAMALDPIGKLPGGIIGTTICLILLLAAALPIMNAMISTVDKETTGPGQVTESGTNAVDADVPTFNYIVPSSMPLQWYISLTSSGWEVTYRENNADKGVTSVDSYEAVISSSEATYSGRLVADGSAVTLEALNGVYVFDTILQGTSITISVSPGSDGVTTYVGMSVADSGGTHIYDYILRDTRILFVQHCSGMPAATHGFVTGDPEAVMGDAAPQDRVIKLDVATAMRKTVINMREVMESGSRQVLLDNGLMLDLDSKGALVTAPASTLAKTASPPLKVSETGLVAVMVHGSTAYDLTNATDVSADFAETWGTYEAPRDLDVPMLEQVSRLGYSLEGWYIPIEWTHTGTGTVTVKTMIYSVVSVVPLILVVALFILVARWMRPESGVKETDALLGGGRPKYDGWRDRR